MALVFSSAEAPAEGRQALSSDHPSAARERLGVLAGLPACSIHILNCPTIARQVRAERCAANQTPIIMPGLPARAVYRPRAASETTAADDVDQQTPSIVHVYTSHLSSERSPVRRDPEVSC